MGTRRGITAALLALLVLALAPVSGAAQDGTAGGTESDSLRDAFLLPVPPPLELPAVTRRPAPAMGANSPLAFGGRLGDVFFMASATARARQVQAVDGTYGFGFSLGDPDRFVALDVAVISFSSFRSGFWKRGGIDLQLSRSLPEGAAIAVGVESAAIWGFTDVPRSWYAVASKWVPLADDPTSPFSGLVLSGGVGTGRFLAVDDLANGTARANVFGSVSVRVLEPLAVTADWTGQDLTALASVAPFARIPASVSLGLADITGAAGESPRFVATAGLALQLGELF